VLSAELHEVRSGSLSERITGNERVAIYQHFIRDVVHDDFCSSLTGTDAVSCNKCFP
jgi:hypothetical protein